MGDIAGDVGTVVRWIAAVVPLVIAFVAWRRFGSKGSLAVVVGYGLVLGGLSLRHLLVALLIDRSNFTSDRLALFLYLGVIVSGIGIVVIVIALRRLIAGVEQQLGAPVESLVESPVDMTGEDRL